MLNNKDTQIAFDCAAFLANAGLGRRIVALQPKDTFFSQGDKADAVFYLQRGRAKLTVVSQNGKEAPSPFSPTATSLEMSRWLPFLDCVWQQLPQSTRALHSRSRGKRWPA